ncbi:CHAD domain-containing protein [Pusillimonas sp. MFBS29]|uniref:CHAD domain-containing protein n=1 Tax=Pusillimonas sp. MFBS29 TaxID=2886690 RepID=UPI001D10B13F|nr:CHAD domain-containing protein [Pusillimonas sp. MFBS29]MCC2596691.1 CHAD domain-containing protein [Pusillimonas sp. MFBS29]
MNKPTPACYQLPVASVNNIINQSVGPLKPVLIFDTDISPYSLLDCFDQPLRQSGRMLLHTDTSLELFGQSGRITAPLPKGAANFITDLPASPLKQALSDLSPLRRLLPCGSGQRQYATLSFTDDEEKTHCRVRLLFITAQEEQAAALALVQPIRGYDASLTAVQQQILDLGGEAFDSMALYGQLFPPQSAYAAKPKISIAHDASAFTAANQIIATHLPIARANEDGIVADYDTEFLHDYRVQLRKIRSVLSLFKGIYAEAQTASLKARFSAIMAPTGPLRDLDVYLLEKQAYYDLLPTELHQGLNTLYNALSEQRHTEHGKLARHLRSPAYQHEIAGLAACFEQAGNLPQGPNALLPAHEYASKLIWKRYRKVCKIASGLDAATPDTEIHALRIQCKKLRYLMEFFATIFPAGPFRKLFKSLKRLQANLGLFNDYSIQQIKLQEMLDALPDGRGNHKFQVAQSVGALIAVLHARQIKERSSIVKSFARFNSPETQDRFRALFQKPKVQAP